MQANQCIQCPARFKTWLLQGGFIILFSFALLPWPKLIGAESAAKAPENFTPREHAWSLGTSFRRMHLSADHDYHLNYVSPTLDFGRGWIHRDWWSSVEFNLILGPNGKRLPESPPLDFTGSGIKLQIAHTWPGQMLRAPNGDWGGVLGLEYSEWTARSFRDEKLPDGHNTDAWVVRSRWIRVQSAVFYSIWQPSRPQGHNPDWISTRIEGVIMSIGLSLPIQAQLQANYVKDNQAQSVTDRWQGLLSFFTVTSWLGI